jgi:hypothetical protein
MSKTSHTLELPACKVEQKCGYHNFMRDVFRKKSQTCLCLNDSENDEDQQMTRRIL